MTLPIKPLESDLAVIIARQIAQRPGLNSDNWYASVNQYFDELQKKSATDSTINVDKIRKQYQFYRKQRHWKESGRSWIILKHFSTPVQNRSRHHLLHFIPYFIRAIKKFWCDIQN